MGIFGRIEDVIKSYLNDDSDDGSSFQRRHGFSDPDVDAAMDELNEYLKSGSSKKRFDESYDQGSFSSHTHTRNTHTQSHGTGGKAASSVPLSIQEAFKELGLSPGASAEECKAAHKKLLKIHHPDRHAGHPGNMKKATEKSARINSAYDRIEKWRQNGRID